MYYVGVDIGGMSLKAGLVDERGVISASKAVPTRAKAPSEEIVSDLAGLVASLLASEGLTVKDIGGIGIGSPGSVNDAAGTVRYSCNINFRMTPIVAMLKEVLGADRVAISNDANCAALGETLFGAGRGAKNSVTVTLGTGIGTGIVADGRLVTGNGSAGAELRRRALRLREARLLRGVRLRLRAHQTDRARHGSSSRKPHARDRERRGRERKNGVYRHETGR